MKAASSGKVLLASITGFALASILYFDGQTTDTIERQLSLRQETTSNRSLSENDQVLVTMFTETTLIDDLCKSMRSLINVQGSLTAPIIIFSTTDLSVADRSFLESCTERSVSFTALDLDFPTGFVPQLNTDYTLAKINRFWTTTVWTHSALEGYNSIMRFDHDTCFTLPDPDLPHFKNEFNNYHSHYFAGNVELNAKRLNGMYALATSYMTENEFQPSHAALWQRIEYTHSAIGSLPNFQDSFEVVRKDFMLRDDIVAWHNALTETAPFGYFTQAWNVDAERFLTMAMFGTTSSVDSSLVPGYMQKNLAAGRRHPKVCS
jgi:hypothetical protein